MRRELNRRKELEKLTPEERAQKEREFKSQREKLREHPKVHEPGHKKSLENVWEEEDHLEKETFNPKTFFMLHDTNSDDRLGKSRDFNRAFQIWVQVASIMSNLLPYELFKQFEEYQFQKVRQNECRFPLPVKIDTKMKGPITRNHFGCSATSTV